MLNEVFNIIKMIDLVRKRPAIYDFSLDEHNNRAIVDNLWKEVADEIGATPTDCKRKWASLRNALSRDSRNEKEASISQRKKKKWYLADHLSFLRTHLNQKNKLLKEPAAILVDDSLEDETKNFFDFSTQDVFNEYLNPDELNTYDNKNSFASVSTNGFGLNEAKHFAVRPPQQQPQQQPQPPPQPPPPAPAPAPSPLKIGHRYVNESANSSVVNESKLYALLKPQPPPPSQHKKIGHPHHYINNSASSCAMNEATKLAAIPPLPPPPTPPSSSLSSSPHINGHNYMNESPVTKPSIADDSMMVFDDRNMTFFKSIIPDVLRLSERKQRLYKQNVITKLNKFLDEQEA